MVTDASLAYSCAYCDETAGTTICDNRDEFEVTLKVELWKDLATTAIFISTKSDWIKSGKENAKDCLLS